MTLEQYDQKLKLVEDGLKVALAAVEVQRHALQFCKPWMGAIAGPLEGEPFGDARHNSGAAYQFDYQSFLNKFLYG